MAIINISPLNVNGVTPQNLLTDLFAPLSGSSQNLIYPLDLASNPAMSHAIQFTVYDYSTNLVGSSNKAVNAIVNLANKAKSAAEAAVNNPGATLSGAVSTAIHPIQSFKSAVTSLKPSEVADVISPLLQGQTYRTIKNGNLATISLYMPDNLTTSYDSNYTTMSMTETFGAGGYLANAYADKELMSKIASGDVANIIETPEGRMAIAKALGMATGAIGGNSGQMTALAAQALKVVPNPQMQLIYQGIGLREFQLDFIFTPISSQEAKMVENIINAFTYFSVPGTYGESGQYLIPPQIFNIKFAFTGQPGILGAVQNVFTNTLSNVLGSDAASELTGGGANAINTSINGSGGAGNAKVFKVGDCVLKSVVVDYAPNGWAAYGDGYPVQTKMTLQFQEMDIVTKNKVKEWTGFDPNNFKVNDNVSK